MSAIDCYKHEHLGWVRCPMRHSMYGDGRVYDRLPVYRLLEDVTDDLQEQMWERIGGRTGDILIGGGRGESSALCFSVPGIFKFYASEPEEETQAEAAPITSYWSEDEAFMFGIGFESLGWHPSEEPLRMWLAEHLMAFLARTYPERYAPLISESPPEQDGAIFTSNQSAELGAAPNDGPAVSTETQSPPEGRHR